MDPPELASKPPRSRIGAALNSVPELRVLGWVMLGQPKDFHCFKCHARNVAGTPTLKSLSFNKHKSALVFYECGIHPKSGGHK